jgi:hypothetical protein
MRKDKRIQELEQDPYKERGHLHDPTVCPECHATYRDGRWTWAAGPADAPRVLCPACRRTRDRHPAGTVVLRGPFLAAHRDDILHLVRNVEEREKAEHALQRILAIEEREGEVEVTTTDLHLARAIGSALHAAHKGDVDYQYADEETHLRVVWER